MIDKQVDIRINGEVNRLLAKYLDKQPDSYVAT